MTKVQRFRLWYIAAVMLLCLGASVYFQRAEFLFAGAGSGLMILFSGWARDQGGSTLK